MAEITRFEDLDAVARDADGALDRERRPSLFDRERRPSLFDRLSWFRRLATYCRQPGRLAVIRAREGGRSAWLFVTIRGAFAKAYANYYSLRFNAVGDPDSALLTAIAADLRSSGIAEVDLAPLEDPEPMREAFRTAGFRAFVTPSTINWRATTAGLDFETFWSQRPSQLRNTAKRRAKAAELDVMVHTRFDETAWADYEAVYRASWKPEEGSFPFLRALAEQEGEAGTLRLGIAKKDGRPFAAQLWLVENGTATIHKLAYAEAAKAMSPGTILSMAMFRHALDEDRVALIDYGNGDEAYKADWMDERRTLWQLRAYDPRTFKGLVGIVKAKLRAWRA